MDEPEHHEPPRRCCAICRAALPPLPTPPPPPRSRAKAAERREHDRLMRRHAAASEPYCSSTCRFKAAIRADEARIRRMGMVPITAEEVERIAPASTAPPRKPKRQRSERTIARDAKLLAELEAEMAEDLAIIRASRRATTA